MKKHYMILLIICIGSLITGSSKFNLRQFADSFRNSSQELKVRKNLQIAPESYSQSDNYQPRRFVQPQTSIENDGYSKPLGHESMQIKQSKYEPFRLERPVAPSAPEAPEATAL